MGHARIRGSRGWVTARGHPARLGTVLDKAGARGGVSPSAVAALRLLMLTGCRKSEILTLRWEHVGLEAGELRLPDAKTGARVVGALSLPVGPISQRSWEIHGLSEETLHAMGARPWAEVHPELLSMLRSATHVLAWRADFDARVLMQTAALHHRALPPVSWTDVRPAYVKARPGGRHSLADAMRREGLEWEGRHHRAEADCRAVLALMHAIANA